MTMRFPAERGVLGLLMRKAGGGLLQQFCTLDRAHHALGHASRDAVIRTVRSSRKVRAGVITSSDETAFRAWVCWLCDQTRMKRRPFPSLVDATLPVLGKMWWFDTLSLRVPYC